MGDYYSAAPYWWPNPDSADGLPYVHRDCERNPATELYSAESNQFDRTALQYMLDGVAASTLCGLRLGDVAALDDAAGLIRTWFLDPATAMNPNMNFAQVRPGHRGGQGAPSGLIEVRDLCFLPDWAYWLHQVRALSAAEYGGLKRWFRELLVWFERSYQGQAERRSSNNHATNNLLLSLSLSHFTGDRGRMAASLARAEEQLAAQFSEGGEQSHEARRPHYLHYCTYNLQAWLLVARLCDHAGSALGPNAVHTFDRAAQVLWALFLDNPAQEEAENFEPRRLRPILMEISCLGRAPWALDALNHARLGGGECEFHPFTGVPVYWRLLFAQ